jgi:hypothetical protein
MTPMYAMIEAPEMWVAIFGAVATVFAALFASLFPFLNSVISKKMELREKQQAAVLKKQNTEAIPETISRTNEVENILHQISDKVRCIRCNIWLFHNGGYYYTGTGIQRISMVCDVGGSKEERLRFQAMPLSIFARNMGKLLKEDYVHEKNELAYSDALGIINQSSAVVSSALFKLRDKTNTDWVGILEMGWEDHNELSTSDVEYIKQMLHSISVLISTKMLRE